MCLHKSHWFPKRAKKDMIVYKFLVCKFDHWITPCIGTPTGLGSIIKSKDNIFLGILTDTIESEGVHAFTNLDHAKAAARCSLTRFVVKAIIPKGAWYYVGKNVDIAASKLLICEEI